MVHPLVGRRPQGRPEGPVVDQRGRVCGDSPYSYHESREVLVFEKLRLDPLLLREADPGIQQDVVGALDPVSGRRDQQPGRVREPDVYRREQELAYRPDPNLGDDGADGGLDGLLHVWPQGFAGRGDAFEPTLESVYSGVRPLAFSRRPCKLSPNRSSFPAKPEVLVHLGEPLVV